MMDLTLVNDVTRAVHLLGLALGFGIAIVADIIAARSLIHPLSRTEIETLKKYHRMVAVGLALFWASGVMLLWLRTGFNPENFSPKLIAKLVVVSLLTLNAILIGRIGLKTISAYRGFRFGDLPLIDRVRLGTLAGLSSAGWLAALLLGVFRELKTMDLAMLSELLGYIYLVGLVGAITVALVAPLVSIIQDRSALRLRL